MVFFRARQKQQHCCLQLPCCLSATVATVCITLTHLKCFLSHPHTLSYTLNTFSLSPRWHFGASSERHCPFVYFLWPHINLYSFLLVLLQQTMLRIHSFMSHCIFVASCMQALESINLNFITRHSFDMLPPMLSPLQFPPASLLLLNK